ncbi:MAG: hypothetical protein ACHQWU_07400 [Gemmatimonadales bacterium]
MTDAFRHPIAVRRRLKFGLIAAGIAAGALFGVALTVLGKNDAGAPPATAANYAWNAALFGVIAGVVAPIVTWSELRRVPIWRTIVEPLGLAVAGAALGVLVGSGILVLALPPAGLVAAFVLLRRRYPQESDALVTRSLEP